MNVLRISCREKFSYSYLRSKGVFLQTGSGTLSNRVAFNATLHSFEQHLPPVCLPKI